MANMNFGVNILPKANNTYSLGNSDYKWNIFANTINGQNVDTFLSAATSKSSGTMSANDKLKLNTIKNDLYYDMDFVDTSFNEFSSQAVLALQSLLSSNYYIISNLRRTSSSSNLNIESSACYYAETTNALPRTDTATSTAPFNKYSYYNIMDIEGELTANKSFYERVDTESAFKPAITMKSGDDVTILVYLAGSVTGSSDAPAKFTLTLDYTDSTSETKNIELTKTAGLSTLDFTLSKKVNKLHVTILCRSGYTFAAQLSWAVLVNAEYTELTSPTFFTKEEIGNKDIFLFPHIYTLTYYVGAKEYVDGVTLPATTSSNGLMSAADKTLVDIFSSFRDTVAIREDGNTAAHNLANDTYILWKGNICKTTAAITGGTTISSSNVYNCGTQDGALNILNDQIKLLAPKADPVFTNSISLGRKNNTTVGDSSIALGSNATASAFCSFAQGGGVTASAAYARAFGAGTTASGNQSLAEGGSTTASGESAHAEGASTTASGAVSHAEGTVTTASYGSAHAEGHYTTSSGFCSHSEGSGTLANHKAQHASGEYNVADSSTETASSRGTYVEIVGNGTTASARSNARALDWSGNEYLNGDIYVNCGADSTGGTKLISTTMVGATATVAGSSGYVPAPTTGDINKFLAGDGTWKSGGLPMVILSYGNSTWQSFIDAYNNNVIVYCRASSNSNPASGSQTRMAFMAYVNDASSPTNVEFQYYRSVNPTSKSISQMCDQVFIYKLDKNSGWSVTTREACIKTIEFDSGTGLTGSFNASNGKLTISNA